LRANALAFDSPNVYYDRRHEAGWMDFWPERKRSRVVELIRNCGIAPGARVLEYGCGPGVFTAAVKEALPSLRLHGCDISAVAVAKARQRCRDAQFRVVEDGIDPFEPESFDLIYTHHVLEHVQDLQAVLAAIARMLKPGGKALHIVPCANAGSIEHRISRLKRHANAPAGCFCCDDLSHVRRLTSGQLCDASAAVGLAVVEGRYANQFWGGIDYLTNEYHWTLLKWLNPLDGADWGAKLELAAITLVLFPFSLARRGPDCVLQTVRRPLSTGKKALYSALVPLAVIGWPFARGLNHLLSGLAECEWRTNNTRPNGSEMYLLFKKTTSPSAAEPGRPRNTSL
jgi:ubiquinone/menaquinone biosynthesis C-methylase UbiE